MRMLCVIVGGMMVGFAAGPRWTDIAIAMLGVFLLLIPVKSC